MAVKQSALFDALIIIGSLLVGIVVLWLLSGEDVWERVRSKVYRD